MPEAKLILYNAKVLTLDPICPYARMIAIGDGKVLAVSQDESYEAFQGVFTSVIDCQGKTVMPGFNDAHCHPVGFAESLITPGITPAAVHSIADIRDKIREASRNLPQGSWVRARGYNEFYLAEKRHPTCWELDEATMDNPVKLTHRTGHAHVLNSLALRLAGISRFTSDPPGGIIDRDLETGDPNGVLYNMGGYLTDIVPPLSDSELKRGVRLASEQFVSMGITSLQDASEHNDIQRWQLFQSWKKQDDLKPRVSMMIGMEAFNHFKEQGFLPDAGDNQLRLGAVKIIIDETTGQLNPSQEVLNREVLEIHQAGYQVAMHAIEETAIDAACFALECALNRYPRADHRHRIEHCSVCTSAMSKRLASLGVMVVTQPAFIYYNGERYLSKVSEVQRQHLYPVGRLMKTGVKVAASSDCPVVPPDPLYGVYAAVSRLAATGQSISPRQRVSPLEILHMYTQNSAYASFDEIVKGSLTPGKLADLIVLSDNPLEVASDKIKDLEVEMTIIGGDIVWRKGI